MHDAYAKRLVVNGTFCASPVVAQFIIGGVLDQPWIARAVCRTPK